MYLLPRTFMWNMVFPQSRVVSVPRKAHPFRRRAILKWGLCMVTVSLLSISLASAQSRVSTPPNLSAEVGVNPRPRHEWEFGLGAGTQHTARGTEDGSWERGFGFHVGLLFPALTKFATAGVYFGGASTSLIGLQRGDDFDFFFGDLGVELLPRMELGPLRPVFRGGLGLVRTAEYMETDGRIINYAGRGTSMGVGLRVPIRKLGSLELSGTYLRGHFDRAERNSVEQDANLDHSGWWTGLSWIL